MNELNIILEKVKNAIIKMQQEISKTESKLNNNCLLNDERIKEKNKLKSLEYCLMELAALQKRIEKVLARENDVLSEYSTLREYYNLGDYFDSFDINPKNDSISFDFINDDENKDIIHK